MGEVERIRASLGTSFGNDLGTRIASTKDRPSKKHHPENGDSSNEDALELHDATIGEEKIEVVYFMPDENHHLDLSA